MNDDGLMFSEQFWTEQLVLALEALLAAEGIYLDERIPENSAHVLKLYRIARAAHLIEVTA